MKNFFDVLKQYVSENRPNFGDGESVLTMLIQYIIKVLHIDLQKE